MKMSLEEQQNNRRKIFEKALKNSQIFLRGQKARKHVITLSDNTDTVTCELRTFLNLVQAAKGED